MSLILNIDTSLDHASICLAKDGNSLAMASNQKQMDHASWLHVAINGLLNETGKRIKELNAVAVSIGPGSYTGLRVGLSSAKGICYALGIPLITIGTLDMMTFAAHQHKLADYYCPLIDARRMEVFTATYNRSLEQVKPPHALIIDQHSFDGLLNKGNVYFFGNGSEKLRSLIENKNASWGSIWGNSSHLAQLSFGKFLQKDFSDLAYSEPLYVKEFYSAKPKTSV
jgi:tRNA threonylcarbamoyladenosine biosynthesis protein TsaB